MSRLYGKLTSDRRKTPATAGANYELEFRITYGSANHPMPVVKGYVTYFKDKEIPDLVIEIPQNIDMDIWVGDGLLHRFRVE